jgi:hypothetical protein
MNELNHPVVRIALGLSLALLMGLLVLRFNGYETSIGWDVTSEASLGKIKALTIEKGPFEFAIQGEKATMIETYFGGPIDRLDNVTLAFGVLILLGLSLMLAASGYLPRYGFIVFAGLAMFFLSRLQLGFLTDQSRWIVAVPIVLLIGPAYAFQAFLKTIPLVWRWLLFVLIMGAMVWFAPGEPIVFIRHFLAYGFLPLILLSIIFIFLISEELIFLLLYFLTHGKASKGNHTHFLILGGIYLVNLGIYYGNKAGLFNFGFSFMDPYVLLTITFGVALWSLKFKQGLIGRFEMVPAAILMFGMAVVTFSLVAFGFARGLDGIYEGLHYFIIYAHLAFGFFFFAYVVINFIDPLAKGLNVYKIVYKPQTFHYATARLAGIAAVAAFYFLSAQYPKRLFDSSKYSLLGDIELAAGENLLAARYYSQSAFFDNLHYPNYQLGFDALNRNNQFEAGYLFNKATMRDPSPQSYVNAANLKRESDIGKAIVMLEEGLQYFPGRAELKNNLGIYWLKQDRPDKAFGYLKDVKSNQDWNQSPQVNYWATAAQTGQSLPDKYTFESVMLPVKINMLSVWLASGHSPEFAYDTNAWKSPHQLHREAWLLNSAWAFADETLLAQMDNEILTPQLIFSEPLRKARVLQAFRLGRVKTALLGYDYLQMDTPMGLAGEYLNDMGLLCLEKHAPEKARDFFDLAIARGNKEARVHKLAALMEAGQFDQAKRHLEVLISVDEAYEVLAPSVVNVFRPGTDSSLEARFGEVYYQVMVWPVSKVISETKKLPPGLQGQVLTKIGNELENRQNPSLTKTYQAAFESAGFQLSIADYAGWKQEDIVRLAQNDPFNETALLLAAGFLAESSPAEAYNLLSDAMDFNPYSVPILKGVALRAAAINFPEYAQTALTRLTYLVPLEEYARFMQEYQMVLRRTQEEWNSL